MRQLLDFLHIGKRRKKKTANAEDGRKTKFDPTKTLIIAGEPVPRAPQPPASVQPAAAESTDAAKASTLEEVVAKRRESWHAPDLDGPEFGGLIERRGVDTRGLMPTKFESKKDDEHRKHSAAASAPKHTPVPESDDLAVQEMLESTGTFLSSLDNSAITLADSGLFRIAEEPEEAAESDGSFNPYDHRTEDLDRSND